MIWIVYLGFALSFLGAWLIWYGEKQVSEQESKALKEENAAKEKQIKTEADGRALELKKRLESTEQNLTQSQNRLFSLNEQLRKKSELIEKKSDLLTEKSEKLNEIILAANRFVELSIGKIQGSPNTFQLVIKNSWPFYVEDVIFSVADFTKMQPFITYINGRPSIKRIDFDNATVYKTTVLTTIPSDDEQLTNYFIIDKGVYTAIIKSKGMTVLEKICFQEIDNEIFFGYIILDIKGKEIKRVSNAYGMLQSSLFASLTNIPIQMDLKN